MGNDSIDLQGRILELYLEKLGLFNITDLKFLIKKVLKLILSFIEK